MRTKIVTLENQNRYSSDLRDVARALRAGALAIFPTETVYGVGANAAHTGAMQRLRQLKGRVAEQGFTVHIPRRADAAKYIAQPSPFARRLARKAWPGPITLICRSPEPAKEPVARTLSPEQLGAIYHDHKVGLRCPAHAAAEDLLIEADAPIVASSANRAGAAPPLDFKAALAQLEGDVEFAIDGGRTRHNTASTIVEIDHEGVSVVREGVIDKRTVERMARTEIVMLCTGNSCRSPIAEYMFRHRLAESLGVSPAELAKQGYHISSAGTGAYGGAPISEYSALELAKRNIDASGHAATPMTIELIQRSELIFALSYEHRRAVIDMVPSAAERVMLLDEKGPVADPIGGGPVEYQNCAAHIEHAVEVRLEEFLNEDRNW